VFIQENYLEPQSQIEKLKGLEPKLHDLALSMGENKTLNSKDKTFLKLFARSSPSNQNENDI
jgi:hypothetical protein